MDREATRTHLSAPRYDWAGQLIRPPFRFSKGSRTFPDWSSFLLCILSGFFHFLFLFQNHEYFFNFAFFWNLWTFLFPRTFFPNSVTFSQIRKLFWINEYIFQLGKYSLNSRLCFNFMTFFQICEHLMESRTFSNSWFFLNWEHCFNSWKSFEFGFFN